MAEHNFSGTEFNEFYQSNVGGLSKSVKKNGDSSKQSQSAFREAITKVSTTIGTAATVTTGAVAGAVVIATTTGIVDIGNKLVLPEVVEVGAQANDQSIFYYGSFIFETPKEVDFEAVLSAGGTIYRTQTQHASEEDFYPARDDDPEGEKEQYYFSFEGVFENLDNEIVYGMEIFYQEGNRRESLYKVDRIEWYVEPAEPLSVTLDNLYASSDYETGSVTYGGFLSIDRLEDFSLAFELHTLEGTLVRTFDLFFSSTDFSQRESLYYYQFNETLSGLDHDVSYLLKASYDGNTLGETSITWTIPSEKEVTLDEFSAESDYDSATISYSGRIAVDQNEDVILNIALRDASGMVVQESEVTCFSNSYLVDGDTYYGEFDGEFGNLNVETDYVINITYEGKSLIEESVTWTIPDHFEITLEGFYTENDAGSKTIAFGATFYMSEARDVQLTALLEGDDNSSQSKTINITENDYGATSQEGVLPYAGSFDDFFDELNIEVSYTVTIAYQSTTLASEAVEWDLTVSLQLESFEATGYADASLVRLTGVLSVDAQVGPIVLVAQLSEVTATGSTPSELSISVDTSSFIDDGNGYYVGSFESVFENADPTSRYSAQLFYGGETLGNSVGVSWESDLSLTLSHFSAYLRSDDNGDYIIYRGLLSATDKSAVSLRIVFGEENPTGATSDYSEAQPVIESANFNAGGIGYHYFLHASYRNNPLPEANTLVSVYAVNATDGTQTLLATTSVV